MKQTIIRLIVVAFLLTISGPALAFDDGGGLPPLCFPGDVGCPK